MEIPKTSLAIPGEISELIIRMYLCTNTDESHYVKSATIACISKAYRDFVRRVRFENITVGYPTTYIPNTGSTLFHSRNAATVISEIAWTKKNKVPIEHFMSFVDHLKYTDSVELVKLMIPSTTEYLSIYVFELDIQSMFVRNAPCSYLYDIACFLGKMERLFTFISTGDVNTLRLLPLRALESIRDMDISLKGPLVATENYVSETVNDITKCRKCSRLSIFDSSLLSSLLFRKLTMRLTRMTVHECELLTDDDFTWFINANKSSLTHFRIKGASCESSKTWQALAQCTEMTELRFSSSIIYPEQFKLVSLANKGMKKLKRLTIEVMLSDASEEAVLDLMLTHSRGGALNYVYIRHCIGIDDPSRIRKRLKEAYKRTSVWVQIGLNAMELIHMNPELSPFEATRYV